jgi:hypothetical protein
MAKLKKAYRTQYRPTFTPLAQAPKHWRKEALEDSDVMLSAQKWPMW